MTWHPLLSGLLLLLPTLGITAPMDYKQLPDSYWQTTLKPEVYHICRQKGTEPAHTGQYDKLYKQGVYNCACCGGDYPLFSSEAKFDSGTGWPSFWAPIDLSHVSLKEDKSGLIGSLFPRTEVQCARCGSHLGHVFNDGPKEHSGKRYCMNSLALHFVSAK